VQFVATVMHEPDRIILDEPFSGFDPSNANLIKDEILELRDRGKTIIFSTHRMESVEELCDHIALIHRSHKVLDGTKRAIKEQFKTHTYHVEYQGTLDHLPPAFSVTNTRPVDEGFLRADIKIPPDAAVNDLIRHLLNQVAVRAFGENIPTMNDIFIQAVGEATE
jgi:ABC-2 type transport system ATP-binding protein